MQGTFHSMAISRLFIFFLAGIVITLGLPDESGSQKLRRIATAPGFADYEISNPSLLITAPEYLLVPYRDGQARFRVLEQEIVPVQADSSQQQLVQDPSLLLISDRQTPVIETGNPGYSRGQMVVPLTIHLARQNQKGSQTFQVVRSMRIRVFDDDPDPSAIRRAAEIAQVAENPLSSGDWYKIPIPADDIYILDAAYLSELGIETGTIDPRNIQIWTTPGYELPHRNADPRPELRQIPILVEGENNGRFDDQDRILFFANGPDRAFFNETTRQYHHRLHPFSNSNYVFLTIGGQRGLRLEAASPGGSAVRDIDRFRDFRWLEEDLEKSESRIKSGTQWFGQGFDPVHSHSQVIMTDTLHGFVQGSDIEVWFSMGARSLETSRFSFTVNGSTALPTLPINSIPSLTAATHLSARIAELRQTLTGFSLQNDIITIAATFENPSSASRGWVNWIRIRAERRLSAHNGRLLFLSPDNGNGELVRYLMTGFSREPFVLDITDPIQPVKLEVQAQGGQHTVIHSSLPGKRILARDTFRRPPAGEEMANQNIRNPSVYPDYIIITAEPFTEEAERLAGYRFERDGLIPVIVTQNQIFNEFNGGVPDFTALRDYVRFLYLRAGAAGRPLPRYLLLFGDTTYDYKNIVANPVMRNFVFTYQSEESIHRTNSYGSDDFFTFMGDNEGLWPQASTPGNPINLMDLGVGRLPVQTRDEARLLVDKIKTYEDHRNRGEWQNLFTFIADDDVAGRSNDGDLHIFNADGTAEVIDQDATGIRLEKIYQISFPFENTSAGRRVPQATQAMIDRINDGTLVFNFSGHGAEQFLTDQRLFSSDDIGRLHNRDRLGIMVTATCSFGRFDDTEDQSGAEKLLLHPDGGIVAAFTTTRVVFTAPSPAVLNMGLNIALTRAMTRRDDDGLPKRLGDIFRETKNTPVGTVFNSRKFILLGDPAMRIGLPEARAEITEINDLPVQPDTLFELRALDRVSLSGHILRPDGTVDTGFNGEASIRVFDAKRLVRYPDLPWVADNDCYLDNCGYHVQTDALFNGRVSVSSGTFRSEFIIPKDVSYSTRSGRAHVFAREQTGSATGANSGFRIRSRNPDAMDDGKGPDITIYLNDELFTDGGIVNDAPQLIVLLNDNTGINTTGAGVGHEIVAIIEDRNDETSRNTIVLNDYYLSDLDDFTSGRIEYPLNNLREGSYRLRVRAWDVFNNLGEAEIHFQVLDSSELQIRNVYNYPNPMHQFTHFIFEHNQPGVPMDVNIRIFTLSGKPVTTIRREQLITSGNMVRIDWHGRDDDNHRLASGTYLYHLQVRADTGQGRQTQDKIERLVIFR